MSYFFTFLISVYLDQQQLSSSLNGYGLIGGYAVSSGMSGVGQSMTTVTQAANGTLLNGAPAGANITVPAAALGAGVALQNNLASQVSCLQILTIYRWKVLNARRKLKYYPLIKYHKVCGMKMKG